ncbi:hypothetical protein [Micromonospora sp. URMC 103]|uniref:hypothetical protein n=1 Tax=Micromonospora sp. URMC 103 TaxID=3423406 RepID=UPI003F1A2A0A
MAVEVVVLADSRQALREAVFRQKTAHEEHEVAFRAAWHEPDEEEPGQRKP